MCDRVRGSPGTLSPSPLELARGTPGYPPACRGRALPPFARWSSRTPPNRPSSEPSKRFGPPFTTCPPTGAPTRRVPLRRHPPLLPVAPRALRSSGLLLGRHYGQGVLGHPRRPGPDVCRAPPPPRLGEVRSDALPLPSKKDLESEPPPLPLPLGRERERPGNHPPPRPACPPGSLGDPPPALLALPGGGGGDFGLSVPDLKLLFHFRVPTPRPVHEEVAEGSSGRARRDSNPTLEASGYCGDFRTCCRGVPRIRPRRSCDPT